MIDKTELKRLADAANAVMGDARVDVAITSESGPNQAEIDAVTSFLQVATPAAVLALLAEIQSLSGIQPSFPPRPPEGEGLPRYGLRWNGPQQPLATPMSDGYWTPWHLADQFQAAIATPESVFINLKAGKIPKPSLRSMIDLYGEVLNGEDAQLLEIAKLRVESEHLRGCEDVLRQLASYCGAGGYNAPEVDPEVFAKKIMDGINILNDPLAQLAEKRGAERDSLKTENEALRGLYQMHKATETREMRYLKTENEALRKDAGRYRWLRGQNWSQSEMAVVCQPKKAVKLGFDCPSEGRLDSAIDSAMSEGEQS